MSAKYLVIALLLCAVVSNRVLGQAKMHIFFNHPVNTALASGVQATYVQNGHMADTIVAYISRAKYSVDIAQYDYNQSSNDGIYANIAAAADTAYSHGIKVRWIYDGSSSNGGLASLNPGIRTLASPTGGSYGIMHNKFIVIDAGSPNPDDPVICTGSPDWSSEMFFKDYNNLVFIQDSAIASAYTAEFNMMWGSTTTTPNATLSKFGPYKTDLGMHTFTVAGHTVELYFSPSDNTDAHIASTILTAHTGLYVGMYDLTRTNDASDIAARKAAGVYTAALVDQYTPTTSSSVNSILSGNLGANYTVYSAYYIYHNKMMIVDPNDSCNDPLVLTGSQNWTTSANSSNDENYVIIHSDTVANIYYQSFMSDFSTISGRSLTAFTGCTAPSTEGVPSINAGETVKVYPDPASHQFTISYGLGEASQVRIDIFSATGQLISTLKNDNEPAGNQTLQHEIAEPGVYFIRLTINGERITKRIVITG